MEMATEMMTIIILHYDLPFHSGEEEAKPELSYGVQVLVDRLPQDLWR